MNIRPTVDLVIPTIGRSTLKTAIMAGLQQTYRKTNVIVIGDGPCPEARQMFESMRALWNPANPHPRYYETHQRLGGYGDFVKRWWIDHHDTGEYIRFLDDDDWIPPHAIADMVGVLDEHTSVVLCGMIMTLGGAVDSSGKGGRWKIVEPEMKPHKATSGTSMIRTVDARVSEFPNGAVADFNLAEDCARGGATKIINMPLYWYCGHQGGKVASKDLPINASYTRPWIFKPPRTFRKSLFSRVPKANFYDGSGRPLLVYDQGLFRPFHRIARKRAWIARKCYYYDRAPESRKTYSFDDVTKCADYITRRGYISTGPTFTPIEARPGAPAVCIVVPAYRHPDKIGRCIRSIARQRGDWECIISVDGGDEETAAAARKEIGDDERFRVTIHAKQLYPMGNILSVVKKIPENQIVMLVDSDDYLLPPDVVEEIIDKYSDTDVEMVCGSNRAMVLGGEDSEPVRRAPHLQERLTWLNARLRENGHPEDMERWRKQRAHVLKKLNENGVLVEG